ncbi:unnamed protein product [Closterium sp. Naga37s-1]|nr:unnamed protein product [Closterium sp. Naga37s-1]
MGSSPPGSAVTSSIASAETPPIAGNTPAAPGADLTVPDLSADVAAAPEAAAPPAENAAAPADGGKQAETPVAAVPPAEVVAAVAAEVAAVVAGGAAVAAGGAASADGGGGAMWKTTLCSFFRKHGECKHGARCKFAHGEAELRARPDGSFDPTSARGGAKRSEAGEGDQSNKGRNRGRKRGGGGSWGREAEEAEGGGDEGKEGGAGGEGEWSRLCVQNLPKWWNVKHFREILNEMSLDYCGSRKSQGVAFGFVSFESAAAADKATQLLNGKLVKNQMLDVQPARPPPLRVRRDPHLPSPPQCVNLRLPSLCEGIHTSPPHPSVQVLHWALRCLPYPLPPTPFSLAFHVPTAHLPCVFEGIYASPVVDGYRNKCEFSIGPSAASQPTIGFLLGNFRDGVTAVAEPSGCRNISPVAIAFARLVQDVVRESPLAAWDKVNNRGFWRLLTVREGTAEPLTATSRPEPAAADVASMDVDQSATAIDGQPPAEKQDDHGTRDEDDTRDDTRIDTREGEGPRHSGRAAVNQVMLLLQVNPACVDRTAVDAELSRLTAEIERRAAEHSPPLPLTLILVQEHSGVSNAAPESCPILVLRPPESCPIRLLYPRSSHIEPSAAVTMAGNGAASGAEEEACTSQGKVKKSAEEALQGEALESTAEGAEAVEAEGAEAVAAAAPAAGEAAEAGGAEATLREAGAAAVAAGAREAACDTHIYDHLCGLKFRLSPTSFFQTNLAGAQLLYQLAASWTNSAGAQLLYQLAASWQQGQQELQEQEQQQGQEQQGQEQGQQQQRGQEQQQQQQQEQEQEQQQQARQGGQGDEKNSVLVFDVCCGTGTIGLCVAKHAKKVNF